MLEKADIHLCIMLSQASNSCMCNTPATPQQFCVHRVESEVPVTKKPRTTNVVVEQAGQTDKVLIDQITDVDSVFDEVM